MDSQRPPAACTPLRNLPTRRKGSRLAPTVAQPARHTDYLDVIHPRCRPRLWLRLALRTGYAPIADGHRVGATPVDSQLALE